MAFKRRPAATHTGSLSLLAIIACIVIYISKDGLLKPGSLAGNGGSGATAALRQQQDALPLPRWDHMPDGVSISMQVPGWASCPRPPCKYTQMVDGPANTSVPWKSQFQEDVWLYNNVFHNKRNGFFVEMGAMDGVALSNTLWLQQAAGWRGLLIEACPEQYKGLALNRRESIAVHAAVCADFRTVHWHSAGNVGGIYEFMAEGFKGIFHKDLKVEHLPAVPCVPMMHILDSFGIDSIDFWSLDVEGAELEVLKTVDFSRLDVKVMMVELDGHAPDKDAAVVQLLEGVGFQKLNKTQKNDMNHYNTVFVKKDAWAALAHAPEVTVVQQ